MPVRDFGHYVALPVDRDSAMVVQAGSPLRLVRVVSPGMETPPPVRIVAEEDAEASVVFVMLPGVMSASLELRADLAGRGARISVYGLYLCGGDEKVSVRTDIRHLVPETSSFQLVKGIAGGRARASFDGRIVVAPEAQMTEALQTNHNILLSEAARVETRPQLEIYADDVKCSHGATVGRMDELEQFYMRSRGIPESEAKYLQLISFISPILDALPEGKRDGISSVAADNLRLILA